MLKILQARLQQYMKYELPDVQPGFRKGRGTRDQIANNCWIIQKAREFQKNIYFCFLPMPKPLIMWITINCGKFWKRWEYQTTWPASWETCMQVRKQVRTGHQTTDWFQIRKGLCQGCILSPCLFNLYAEYILRNAGLEEAQDGLRLSGKISIMKICRWHHPYGRMWRRTEEPLDESERGDWKSWLKAQHSEN